PVAKKSSPPKSARSPSRRAREPAATLPLPREEVHRMSSRGIVIAKSTGHGRARATVAITVTTPSHTTRFGIADLQRHSPPARRDGAALQQLQPSSQTQQGVSDVLSSLDGWGSGCP